MSLIRISKEFHWEMGHRIPWHEGGCANVHGHSYRATIEVAGEVGSDGMVMDYGDLSALMKPLVARMDHSYMVDPTDEPMKELLAATGLKALPVPFYTTAENIAAWILDQLKESLERPNLAEIVVRVHETRTTTAEARWTRSS